MKSSCVVPLKRVFQPGRINFSPTSMHFRDKNPAARMS